MAEKNYGNVNRCISCGETISEEGWICKLCEKGDPELIRAKELALMRWLIREINRDKKSTIKLIIRRKSIGNKYSSRMAAPKMSKYYGTRYNSLYFLRTSAKSNRRLHSI